MTSSSPPNPAATPSLATPATTPSSPRAASTPLFGTGPAGDDTINCPEQHLHLHRRRPGHRHRNRRPLRHRIKCRAHHLPNRNQLPLRHRLQRLQQKRQTRPRRTRFRRLDPLPRHLQYRLLPNRRSHNNHRRQRPLHFNNLQAGRLHRPRHPPQRLATNHTEKQSRPTCHVDGQERDQWVAVRGTEDLGRRRRQPELVPESFDLPAAKKIRPSAIFDRRCFRCLTNLRTASTMRRWTSRCIV